MKTLAQHHAEQMRAELAQEAKEQYALDNFQDELRAVSEHTITGEVDAEIVKAVRRARIAVRRSEPDINDEDALLVGRLLLVKVAKQILTDLEDCYE